ncbi:MAG: NAD+ synthase [Gammaproteobacteria bacterium]|nr:MAG: NAD+ synthase [Gammaproteobacteria bacterium]
MALTIGMAQINPLVGDIPGNVQRVVDVARQAHHAGMQVVVFPELTLTGYPPEDLLLRSSLDVRMAAAWEQLCQQLPKDLWVICGYPKRTGKGLGNTAGVFHGGRLLAEYTKQHLPNYQVFDEKRYFVTGDAPCVIDIAGTPVAITICEDIWEPAPMAQARAAGARLMLNINASPFHGGKPAERLALLQQRARDGDMPVVYVNQVGGQDELVFDGGSIAMGRDGQCKAQAAWYEECLLPVVFDGQELQPGRITPALDEDAALYQALVLGVRDYVNKNRFPSVLLGLSGGIDSALTLAIAVDALGKERVSAVMMPFRYTSSMSLEDAEAEARVLGVDYRVLSIEPMFESFMATLSEEFAGLPVDVTEQNIQARCRGVLLMALSNKSGGLVLTTGNKSEMAVGYATLYGDMAGGLDVLKDVYKTRVYALSRYRNRISPVIPQRVIDRPPSAELAPDQKDSDSLPDYDSLDAILERYIEHDQSASAIIADGFTEADVYHVIRLVDRNEYKRRQAAIGLRVTRRGFGRDRRYPVTSGWKAGD